MDPKTFIRMITQASNLWSPAVSDIVRMEKRIGEIISEA